MIFLPGTLAEETYEGDWENDERHGLVLAFNLPFYCCLLTMCYSFFAGLESTPTRLKMAQCMKAIGSMVFAREKERSPLRMGVIIEGILSRNICGVEAHMLAVIVPSMMESGE